MISLKRVTIHKYKCIETDQSFDIDPNVTVLVGMNESGKTAILESIAKTNYFEKDDRFTLNSTHDYPRKEKKRMDKKGIVPSALTCEFDISSDLIDQIAADVGKDIFKQTCIERSFSYDNKGMFLNLKTDFKKFVYKKTQKLGISSKTLHNKLYLAQSIPDLEKIIDGYKDSEYKEKLKTLSAYFKNDWKWEGNPLGEYIARRWLKPNLPKFLYYDEYYSLPSRISIEKLRDENLESDELKTAKALFELSDINIDELLKSDDFEDFKAELEATEATITDELFEYWTTNQNLEIQFDIDKKEKTDQQGNNRIVEHVLDIRVKNTRARVSLPLKNRSKGFNWFFSFLVWFKKIQEDSSSNYIILLDEPGLNLHAAAQADLLKFIEFLSSNYQIIYTTHSPFMVDPSKLNRVRTPQNTASF